MRKCTIPQLVVLRKSKTADFSTNANDANIFSLHGSGGPYLLFENDELAESLDLSSVGQESSLTLALLSHFPVLLLQVRCTLTLVSLIHPAQSIVNVGFFSLGGGGVLQIQLFTGLCYCQNKMVALGQLQSTQ